MPMYTDTDNPPPRPRARHALTFSLSPRPSMHSPSSRSLLGRAMPMYTDMDLTFGVEAAPGKNGSVECEPGV